MDVDKSLLLKSSDLLRLVDYLLLESSADVPSDILHTNPHPSDLTLVLLAAEVYKEKEFGETDEDYGDYLDLPKGWRLLITGSNSGSTNGYFGAAFVDVKSQQVVVAHRGTILTDTGALFTDVLGICGTQYTGCMNSAITFVDQIRQVLHTVNTQHGRSYNLAMTGHSLGGWLAQVTAFTLKWLNASDGVLKKNTGSGFHAKTVVFDSPGAKDMLNKMWDDYFYRSTTDIFDWLNIIVYVSAPNRINTCGAHVGRVYRVITDVSSFSWKDIKTGWYNVKTHEIYNFTNAFKQKSPHISEVLDWAKDRAEFSGLFGKHALNSVNNYHLDFKELIEKLNKIVKRYKVIPAALHSDAEISAIIHFNAFSEDEFQILNQLMIIQKHQRNYDVVNRLLLVKNLILENGNLFPHFQINHNNRTIICRSKQQLGELNNRVKQLVRWLGPEFSKAVEEQSRHADLIYRDEGQTYLDSLPKTSLNFIDSIGLQEFLLSPTDRVLWINSKNGTFEMTRLYNIFSQIKEKINILSPSNQYTGESQYIFLDWPRLQKLYKKYGSPIEQNNLMMIDESSPLSVSIENGNLFENYFHCSPLNMKKLVYICSEPRKDKFNSSENIREVKIDQKLSLTDLSTESQKIVLKRKLILTGHLVKSFNDFMGDNFLISEVNQFLSINHFKKIVTNENYVISLKDTRPMISDLQMPLIKTNYMTSKEYVLNCVDLPNCLVVINGLNRGDLETGGDWEQLGGKEIILAEGDAELLFKDTCNNNQHKTIYLFEVSRDFNEDVHCKQIFNRGFYIPRKFFHRACFNVRKFAETEHADDIFVVSSEEHNTAVLSIIEKSEKREEFAKNLQIATTKEREAYIIQNFSHKNIHFVEIVKGKKRFELEWRYSNGSVESLRTFVSTNTFDPIDELTLSKTERHLVIISDEPGMGKTTSLARLSWCIESPWVIYIELKQFKSHINNLSDKFTPQNVAHFLLSECSSADSTLDHGLLEYFLRSKTYSKRVVLMFDGFDELDDYIKNKESSKDKLVKLFAFLQSKPSIQVFLTVRKYLKESLERKLNQFSTTFLTINKRGQQDLLYVFWQSFLPLAREINREEEEGRLKEYAGEVLRQAKQVLGPDMDCFMGVPLQLRMLAEVFRPQSDLLIQSLEALYEKINIVSAPNLYKMFISLKYDIYLHDKTLIGKALDEDEILEYTKSLTKEHGELGFRTFFAEFYDSNKNDFEDISEKRLIKLNRLGLIQTTGNGNFHFIHRTYAEYCCAQIIVFWLDQQKKFQQNCNFKYQLTEEILLPQVLLHPDSKVIRLFMNVELEEMAMTAHTLKLNPEHVTRLWFERNEIFRNEEHQTALHIAVQERNEHIITLLFSGFDIKSSQEVFVSYITQYDIDCDTALHIMDKKAFHRNIEDDSLYCDRIMRFLLKCIETCSDETREKVLFTCLFNRNISKSYVSKYILKSDNVSGDTLKILKKVIERLKNVGLEVNQFKTALTLNIGKLVTEILTERLINNIECYCLILMKHKDQGMKTALHLAAQGGYLDIIKLLVEQTSVPFILLMARRDCDQMTPLLTAAGLGHLDIVKFLKERGSDINTRCRRGKSALLFAAGGGHVQTVEYLIKSGADIKSTNKRGGTVLHIAAHRGHLPIIEYLVKSGIDINSTNDIGETAFHVAARKGHLLIIEYLIKSGVKTNTVDSNGRTVMHFAAHEGHLPVVEYFCKNGFDMKARDNYGYTALHVAALNDRLQVMEYLVASGADKNCTNNNGETALYTAVQRGYLSIVKYLLQKGVDPDRVNKLGGTALTWASQCRKWDIARLLLAWGADVNADGGKFLSRAINREEWSIVESLVGKGALVRESKIHSNLSEFKEKFPNYTFKPEPYSK